MQKVLPKILFLYSAIASLFIAVSITLTTESFIPVIFGVLFLPVAGYFISETFKQFRSGSDNLPAPKKGEIAVMFLIFLILLGLGVRNIYANSIPTIDNTGRPPEASSSALIFKNTVSESPSPVSKFPKLKVTISDGSESINIRAKATIYSDKVGTTKDGDIFEYTQKENGWYQIKMTDGSTGFLSPLYVKEINQ